MRCKLISFKLCPFVQRAVITLREKGVDFDLVYIDLDEPPDWFERISPFGKVPLLLVEQTVLFESAVILDYLDEAYPPRLHPADPLLRAQHKAWIEYGSDLLMRQRAVAEAAGEAEFDEALSRLNVRVERLRLPLEEGIFGGGEGRTLVDAAFAPFFMRMEILSAMGREIRAAYPPQVAAWSMELLAWPSLQGSVVEDFVLSYRQFLKQKGSWLASLPAGA